MLWKISLLFESRNVFGKFEPAFERRRNFILESASYKQAWKDVTDVLIAWKVNGTSLYNGPLSHEVACARNPRHYQITVTNIRSAKHRDLRWSDQNAITWVDGGKVVERDMTPEEKEFMESYDRQMRFRSLAACR